MTDRTADTIELDTAVIGGGIAGLWLLDRLRTSGYSAALFTERALGEGQTLASQGMIHGGIKYTLAGALSGASEAIADMPDYWRRCMAGQGDVDLRQTRTLSDHFYMFANSRRGRLTGFFASKAVRGRIDKVSPEHYPALFDTPAFKGSLYRLQDTVLDVPSLLANLAENNRGHLFQIDKHQSALRQRSGQITLTLDDGTRVKARRWILASGKHNAQLLHQLDCERPAQQLRPLRQVVVRHRYPYRFFGHGLGADKTPQLTISSHPGQSGETVWYLGGALAEQGARQSDAQVIERAREQLRDLFPWLDFSDAEFSTLFIERAEPRQPGLIRPDNAYAEPAPELPQAIVAWPTKLTLVPDLANRVLALLPPPEGGTRALTQLADRLAAPTVASLPWEDQ